MKSSCFPIRNYGGNFRIFRIEEHHTKTNVNMCVVRSACYTINVVISQFNVAIQCSSRNCIVIAFAEQ